MKKALLFVTIAFTAITMQAQKVDKAKDLLNKKKTAEAKTEIDNFLAIEKNKTNKEIAVFLLKTTGLNLQNR